MISDYIIQQSKDREKGTKARNFEFVVVNQDILTVWVCVKHGHKVNNLTVLGPIGQVQKHENLTGN